MRSAISLLLLLPTPPALAAVQAMNDAPIVAAPATGSTNAMSAMNMSSAPPDAAAAANPAAMANMPGMAGMDMGGMQGALARYPAARDASGTSWQPDSAPMEDITGALGPWSTMAHGYASLVYDDQGGPRGAIETFSESMLMGMAQRPLGTGVLTLRAMGSLDPLMGPSGYPLLLQTGETADGRTELVDRQHPHDLVMELAGAYSHPIADRLSGFVYFGYPGEPALGPTTFMHRFSGETNPEAPISHHWLDSTHVTFGVATAGVVYDRVKIEASIFTGREPDQHRYDFDPARFDSWSVRGTWNPIDDLSMQISHGHIVSPEQLTPDVDQDRTTASATYNRPMAHGDWQTTFAWGIDVNRPGRATDAFLLESALSRGAHTVFGRAETVAKDELFANEPTSPLYDRAFNVAKFTFGYFYTLAVEKHLGLDLGGLVSRYALPAVLIATYGPDPTSFMLFARIKLE
jgi:hypothetical protein